MLSDFHFLTVVRCCATVKSPLATLRASILSLDHFSTNLGPHLHATGIPVFPGLLEPRWSSASSPGARQLAPWLLGVSSIRKRQTARRKSTSPETIEARSAQNRDGRWGRGVPRAPSEASHCQARGIPKSDLFAACRWRSGSSSRFGLGRARVNTRRRPEWGAVIRKGGGAPSQDGPPGTRAQERVKVGECGVIQEWLLSGCTVIRQYGPKHLITKQDWLLTRGQVWQNS